MVIRLVAHRNFLLLDLSPEFSIHLLASRDSGRHRVILEDPAHVVEQLSDRQHHRGRAEIVSLLQEELSIRIPLGGGAAEPHHRLCLIFRKSLSRQAQLAQHVLGVLVSRLCRLRELIRRSGGVLADGVSLQILFAQTVSSKVASVFRRLFQPADALVRVPHFPIAREKQLAKGVLCFR